MPPSHDRTHWRTDPASYQVAPQRASHAPGRTAAAGQSTSCLQRATGNSSGCFGAGTSTALERPTGLRNGGPKDSCAHSYSRQHGARGEPSRGRTCERMGGKVRPTWCADCVPERVSSARIPRLFDPTRALRRCPTELWSWPSNTFRAQNLEGFDSWETVRVPCAGPGRVCPGFPQRRPRKHLALATRDLNLREIAAAGGRP